MDKSKAPEEKVNWSEKALAAKNAVGPDGKNVAKLLALGQAIVTNPKFQESEGKTYCNLAVQEACRKYKAEGLNGLLANEMIRKIEKSSDWQPVTASEAWDQARKGNLVVATLPGNQHGHIALVAPTNRVWSQKWSAYVPSLYNVGPAKMMNLSDPYTIGENFAFALRPNHYAYLPEA